MKKFNFEYTSLRALLLIFILCFAAFGSLVFLLLKIKAFIGIENGLVKAFNIAIIMIVPYLIFLMNKKKIKMSGTAFIYDNYVELRLPKSTINIKYVDIKSYMIQFYNGAQLKLKMEDGEKINLIANTFFCKSGQFELFCEHLEQSIENHNLKNNIASNRDKSFFEKKWVYYFLIVMTIALAIVSILSIIVLKKVTSSFFMAIGSIVMLWGGYLNNKARRTKKDI